MVAQLKDRRNCGTVRQIEEIQRWTVHIAAIGLAVFHIYTGVFGLWISPEQKAVHVGLTLLLVFLLIPMRKTSSAKARAQWWDLLLISAILAGSIYTFLNWDRFLPVMIGPPNTIERVMAVAMIIAVLEAGRRTVGWVFPILTTLCVGYGFWGHYIPGYFGHAPFAAITTLKIIYFSADGIWGFLTGLSATYIALFILFGAILLTSGGGKTFIDLALVLTGKYRGGPAKVAVLSSGFFGMLSGSAMANVATTGTFTIPMMKKLGYSPEFAGGVESVASTGGLVMPPIMGASAFIMAEFLNIPYLSVAIAAAAPAILFYTATFMGVHFQAVKLNLRPVPPEERPPLKAILTYSRISCLVIPLGVLLYTLFEGYSLTLVGSAACLAALGAYIFSDLSWSNMKGRLRKVPPTLEAGGKALIHVVPVLVCANIVLGLLNGTGLSIKFSLLIMTMGETNVLLSLGMAGVLVMILGCGLPATAAYVIGIAVAGQLLISWGIMPIAAHLFLFYYSLIALITPPVCPAVFVASGIAQSRWLGTAWVAVRLAPLLYIMPFLFVFDSTFLMMGAPLAILLNVGTAVFGAIILASGTIGQFIVKCRVYEILALVVAGLLLLLPGWQFDLPGALLTAAIVVKQLSQRRKEVTAKMVTT